LAGEATEYREEVPKARGCGRERGNRLNHGPCWSPSKYILRVKNRFNMSFFSSIKQVFRKIKRALPATLIYPLCLYVLLSVNVVTLFREIAQTKSTRQKTPYFFLGAKFFGISGILKKEARVGYMTDKDLDDRVAAMQFSQAQLILAPTILELNGSGHKFAIYDYANPVQALKEIKASRLHPLARNRFGLILAGERPKAIAPALKFFSQQEP